MRNNNQTVHKIVDRRKLSRVLQKTKFNDHCLHSCVLVTPIKNVPNEFAYLWKNWQVYGPLQNEIQNLVEIFCCFQKQYDYRCKNSMTTDKKYEDPHIGYYIAHRLDHLSLRISFMALHALQFPNS